MKFTLNRTIRPLPTPRLPKDCNQTVYVWISLRDVPNASDHMFILDVVRMGIRSRLQRACLGDVMCIWPNGLLEISVSWVPGADESLRKIINCETSEFTFWYRR